MNEIQQEWRYMGRQQDEVYDVMKDQEWHTLEEVSTAVDGRQTSVSACIRNFRKESYGGYVVERKRENGEYLYRLLLHKDSA
jgi:hypothetical protein